LASYLLEPQVKRNTLDELVLERFKVVKTPIEALIGKGKNKITLQDVPLDLIEPFACEAVDYIVRLRAHFEKELVKSGLEKVFQETELPLLPILADMEKTGIYLDTDCLQKIGQNLMQELQTVEKK